MAEIIHTEYIDNAELRIAKDSGNYVVNVTFDKKEEHIRRVDMDLGIQAAFNQVHELFWDVKRTLR